MNKDIRLSIGFLDHPKIMKLERILGWPGIKALLRLWCFAAQYKTDGVMAHMSVEDIEMAAKWSGPDGQFVSTLETLVLIDQTNDGYALHDWIDHNGFCAHYKQRSAAGRYAAEKRWEKSRSTLAPHGNASSNAKGNATRMRTACAEQCDSHAHGTAIRNAPIPIPIPIPVPVPDPESAFERDNVSAGPNPPKGDEDKTTLATLQDYGTQAPAQPPPAAEQRQQLDACLRAAAAALRPADIFISIPLKDKDREYSVTHDQVKEWRNTYPLLDVEQTLKAIRQWNLANPAKRKTQTGILRHIESWLRSEQARLTANGKNQPSPSELYFAPEVVKAKLAEAERRLHATSTAITGGSRGGEGGTGSLPDRQQSPAD